MKTFGAWLRVLGPLLIIVLGVVQIALARFARLLDQEIVGWRRILRQRWMRYIWILVF